VQEARNFRRSFFGRSGDLDSILQSSRREAEEDRAQGRGRDREAAAWALRASELQAEKETMAASLRQTRVDSEDREERQRQQLRDLVGEVQRAAPIVQGLEQEHQEALEEIERLKALLRNAKADAEAAWQAERDAREVAQARGADLRRCEDRVEAARRRRCSALDARIYTEQCHRDDAVLVSCFSTWSARARTETNRRLRRAWEGRLDLLLHVARRHWRGRLRSWMRRVVLAWLATVRGDVIQSLGRLAADGRAAQHGLPWPRSPVPSASVPLRSSGPVVPPPEHRFSPRGAQPSQLARSRVSTPPRRPGVRTIPGDELPARPRSPLEIRVGSESPRGARIAAGRAMGPPAARRGRSADSGAREPVRRPRASSWSPRPVDEPCCWLSEMQGRDRSGELWPSASFWKSGGDSDGASAAARGALLDVLSMRDKLSEVKHLEARKAKLSQDLNEMWGQTFVCDQDLVNLRRHCAEQEDQAIEMQKRVHHLQGCVVGMERRVAREHKCQALRDRVLTRRGFREFVISCRQHRGFRALRTKLDRREGKRGLRQWSRAASWLSLQEASTTRAMQTHFLRWKLWLQDLRRSVINHEWFLRRLLRIWRHYACAEEAQAICEQRQQARALAAWVHAFAVRMSVGRAPLLRRGFRAWGCILRRRHARQAVELRQGQRMARAVLERWSQEYLDATAVQVAVIKAERLDFRWRGQRLFNHWRDFTGKRTIDRRKGQWLQRQVASRAVARATRVWCNALEGKRQARVWRAWKGCARLSSLRDAKQSGLLSAAWRGWHLIMRQHKRRTLGLQAIAGRVDRRSLGAVLREWYRCLHWRIREDLELTGCLWASTSRGDAGRQSALLGAPHAGGVQRSAAALRSLEAYRHPALKRQGSAPTLHAPGGGTFGRRPFEDTSIFRDASRVPLSPPRRDWSVRSRVPAIDVPDASVLRAVEARFDELHHKLLTEQGI